MTTPDVRGLSEELGIVEVYGAPISTFTRTITLALHHTGLPFVFRHHLPHSAEIKEHNPLGLVPVLIHRPNALYSPKDSLVLYESNAIRRYIDDALIVVARAKQHNIPDLNPALDTSNSRQLLKTASMRASVDQIVSVASTTVFTALEHRVIKPRQAMESNGADDATIGVALEEGLAGARLVMKLLEGFLSENKTVHGAKGDWFVGNSITWADLYVYPILADLKSIPEGSDLLSQTPLLSAWVQHMESTPIAQATYPGSVPQLRQKM
ncbi:unnamed protein product [Parajaminaea phylloscopi]